MENKTPKQATLWNMKHYHHLVGKILFYKQNLKSLINKGYEVNI